MIGVPNGPPPFAVPPPPEKWYRFTVKLEDYPNGVSFQALINATKPKASQGDGTDGDGGGLPEDGLTQPAERSQRFNLIADLEARFGGGEAMGVEGEPADAHTGRRGKKRRQRDPDSEEENDSDADFIDDSDVLATIEQEAQLRGTVLKQTGFFVNGGELKTSARPKGINMPAGGTELPQTVLKRRRGSGVKRSTETGSNKTNDSSKKGVETGKKTTSELFSSKPCKGGMSTSRQKKLSKASTATTATVAVIDKAASALVGQVQPAVAPPYSLSAGECIAWNPTNDMQQAIAAFKSEYATFAEHSSFGTGAGEEFPRDLEAALSHLDNVIKDIEPSAVQSQGYINALAEGLPFSSTQIGQSVRRLQKGEEAERSKLVLDGLLLDFQQMAKACIAAQSQEGTAPTATATAVPEEGGPISGPGTIPGPISGRVPFQWDANLREVLYNVLRALETYVERTNEYRKLLAPSQVKSLPSDERKQLGPIKEKKRLLQRLLPLWGEGGMDAKDLSKVYQMEKNRIGSKKPSAVAASTASTSGGGGLTTRGPLRATLFDCPPAFDEADFPEQAGKKT